MDISSTVDVKGEAVACHRSQFPDGVEWASTAVRLGAEDAGRQAAWPSPRDSGGCASVGEWPPPEPEPATVGGRRGGQASDWADRVILHVDMDAFFASVEVLDDPSLAGLPVIVGGSGPRGVVAACTYEARRFGVHSAMASSVARRLCPTAVFVDGRFHRYAEESKKLHAIFHSITPLVEGISLDEAFLDVTGSRTLLGEGPTIATTIRRRVADELRLRCSVGVGRSKFMAKLASKAAKPTATRAGIVDGPGVVVVSPDQELGFLHPLPVRALWGVGPVTGRKLESLGILTVGDLAALPAGALERYLGTAQGSHLAELAHGHDHARSFPSRKPSPSATRRPSRRTCGTERPSTVTSSGWWTRRRPPSGVRSWQPGPSPSRCGSRTSR